MVLEGTSRSPAGTAGAAGAAEAAFGPALGAAALLSAPFPCPGFSGFSFLASGNRNTLTVVLQWCYSGVTVVLKWCYSGIRVVLQ
jgi:hypothetical protein